MSHQPIVITLPAAAGALHSLAARGGEKVAVALVPPTDALTLATPSFAEALASARQRGAHITVISPHVSVRLAALELGVCASTDVAEWRCWLEDSRLRAAREARRRQSSETLPGALGIVRPAFHPSDSLPGYVLALGGGQEAMFDAIPADERYEMHITDRIRATGGFDAVEPSRRLG